MREQSVEHAIDEQVAGAEEAPVNPGKKSAGASSNDNSNSDPDFIASDYELEEDDDDLFVSNVDQGVTYELMGKGRKGAATSTTKFKQANRSLKVMESNQETSPLSPPEDSICPPLEKRQKTLSDKDGEKCDAHSPDCAYETALCMRGKGDCAEDEQGKKSRLLCST